MYLHQCLTESFVNQKVFSTVKSHYHEFQNFQDNPTFFMLRPPALHKEAVFGTSNQLWDIHGNLDIDITDIKILLHNTVLLMLDKFPTF